jgi:hypothetical protein
VTGVRKEHSGLDLARKPKLGLQSSSFTKEERAGGYLALLVVRIKGCKKVWTGSLNCGPQHFPSMSFFLPQPFNASLLHFLTMTGLLAR